MTTRPRTVPRKVPKQARSRATLDAILEATARVLVREGFDRASTNRVAREAGVSIGSLYQYFPSKEALVSALIDRHIDDMWRLLAAEVRRLMAMPIEAAVRRTVEMMLRAHAVDPKLHKVLHEQVPRVGRLERFHDVEQRMLDVARGYLAAHRAEIRPQDVDTAAFIVVTTIEALTHAAVLSAPERLADGRLAAEITDLVVSYLRGRS